MLRTTHMRFGVFIAAASLVACLDQVTEPTVVLLDIPTFSVT